MTLVSAKPLIFSVIEFLSIPAFAYLDLFAVRPQRHGCWRNGMPSRKTCIEEAAALADYGWSLLLMFNQQLLLQAAEGVLCLRVILQNCP